MHIKIRYISKIRPSASFGAKNNKSSGLFLRGGGHDKVLSYTVVKIIIVSYTVFFYCYAKSLNTLLLHINSINWLELILNLNRFLICTTITPF